MNDHNNGMHTAGNGDDGGRTLDDILVGALARRSGQARPGTGSIRDVRLRARRRARRRTAVGGGMIVAVGALSVAYVGRGDDTGQRIATGDGAGTPFAGDDTGASGPWECTGLIGTSSGAVSTVSSTIPAPIPTTTSPGFDSFTTTTVSVLDEVASTTIDPSANASTVAPFTTVTTTLSADGNGNGGATSTTFPPATTILLPSMVSSTVPSGLDTTLVPSGGAVSGDAAVGPDATYTLQSCTLVGAVPPAPDTTVTATFDPGDTVPANPDPGITVPALLVDDTTTPGG